MGTRRDEGKQGDCMHHMSEEPDRFQVHEESYHISPGKERTCMQPLWKEFHRTKSPKASQIDSFQFDAFPVSNMS